MRHYWWKFLSAFLVLLTIILALRTPLSPGIPKVSPDQLNNGVTSVTVTGYNTRFQDAEESLEIWVQNGSSVFCPFEYTVLDNTHLRATFSVTAKIGESFFDLYVYNEKDGKMYLPSALLQNGLEVVSNPPTLEGCKPEIHSVNTSFDFPNQPILNETIRNLFLHVPSWFAMIAVMLVSLVYSIKFLRNGQLGDDLMALNSAHVGLLFAFIGLATGSLWARFTWGAWWVADPRLNGAAIAVLIYLAYFVLRSSVNDRKKASRLAAVYNIFAFVMMLLFIMILPRMTDSLHPGVGGNPAFSQYDLDDNMRLVFYPAVIGWIGMALWMVNLKTRMARLNFKKIYNESV